MRSGTRESHNKLEKNRRAQMRACFLDLKEALPKDQEEKKTSNLSILSNALKYIMVSGRWRLFRYVFSIPIRAELRFGDCFRERANRITYSTIHVQFSEGRRN